MDAKQIFSELQGLPFAGENCPQCLIPLPSGVKGDVLTYNAPQFLRESMQDLRKLISCRGCRQSFHLLCVRDKSDDFICANCAQINDSEVRCCVCYNSLGYCEVFYFYGEIYRAHFVCVYFSKNFLLKSARKLEFVAIEIPLNSLEGSMCQICDKGIHQSCSAFKCDCNYVSHIFCTLYITANFHQIPSLSSFDLDQLYLPVWLLERPSIFPYNALFPGTNAIVALLNKNEQLREAPLTYEDEFFVFKMYCPLHRIGMTSFCTCHTDSKPHYMQCDYCQSWYHVRPCAATYPLDFTNLDVLKLPESLREISSTNLFSVTAKYGKGGFALRKGKLEAMEFMCKFCQRAGFHTFSNDDPTRKMVHKSLPVLIWMLLRYENNQNNGFANFILPSTLYLKQEGVILQARINEIPVLSTPAKITTKTPTNRSKSKQLSTPVPASSTPKNMRSSPFRCQSELENEKEPDLLDNSVAPSIDGFEEALSAFLIESSTQSLKPTTGEFFYDRLVQLHIFCEHAIKDSQKTPPSNVLFYTHLLQATLDFLDNSKGFSVRKIEKKLQRFHANAPSPKAKNILINFVKFINQRFLSDVVEFIGTIRPYLRSQYLLIDKTFALLENDVKSGFQQLLTARITSPELLNLFSHKASSHFCKQLKKRFVADEEAFSTLLPLQSYKDAIAKLKMVVGCFFLKEEQAHQAINFFQALFKYSGEKQTQVALSKRLKNQTEKNFDEYAYSMDAKTLTIEELQESRQGEKALFFTNESADAALFSFNSCKTQVDSIMQEFYRDRSPKLLFRALKLLHGVGSVPPEAVKDLSISYAALGELKAYLKGRISCMTAERFNLLLSSVEEKDLGAKLYARACAVSGRLAEISLIVERFYNSLNGNDHRDCGSRNSNSLNVYSFSPQGAEHITTLWQELSALRLQMSDLETLRANFLLAQECNNAILSVYSLDYEEEFQFSDFELVPQSATLEILARISKIKVNKYVLSALEHAHVKAKESYVLRVLKEKHLPISFLSSALEICPPDGLSELLLQRIAQVSLIKEKIHLFFKSSLNIYGDNLDLLGKKADEILRLAMDFIIDEARLMDQLRRVRLIKLNIFLIISMRTFLEETEKALQGTCSPPKSGDYANVFKILSGRIDFLRCPQMERLVAEFLSAYSKVQTLEEDYWCIQQKSGLDLNAVYEMQLRMETFPLLALEATPLICSKIEEHHRLCEVLGNEVEVLKKKSCTEVLSLRENLEKLCEDARSSAIFSDRLKIILKPLELLVMLFRSTLITLSSLQVIGDRLAEQLGQCFLCEDIKFNIGSLEAALNTWRELKQGVDKENIPQLEHMQRSLITPFRVELIGKPLIEIQAQISACLKALQGDFRPYLELRSCDISFRGQAADRYKALIEKIEYINSYTTLATTAEKRLQIFHYINSITQGICGKLSRSVCFVYKEILEKRENFESEMRNLITQVLEMANNIGTSSFRMWPPLEEFGPGTEFSNPTSFLKHERSFYKIFFFLYDAFSFLCEQKLFSEKKVAIRYMAYIKIKFIEKKTTKKLDENYSIIINLCNLLSRYNIGENNFLLSDHDEANISEPLLLAKIPENAERFYHYFQLRSHHAQERIEFELGNEIQKQQRQWTNFLELFDANKFQHNEEKLFQLCNNVDTLLRPTQPSEIYLQSLWTLSANERKRLRNKLSKYAVTLNDNPDEREYLLKYNMDLAVLLRRANEIHARENLIHRLDISKEQSIQSPVCSQKRVKKASMADKNRYAKLLKEKLFPTNIEIQLSSGKAVQLYSLIMPPQPNIANNITLTLKEETEMINIHAQLEEVKNEKALIWGWLNPPPFFERKDRRVFQNFQKLMYMEKERGLAFMFEHCPEKFKPFFMPSKLDCSTFELRKFICAFVIL